MPENVVVMDIDKFMKLWDTFKATPPNSLTLMACVVVDGAVQVHFVGRIRDLFLYPDETLVVAQSRTETASKFAEFTVGQIRVQQGSFGA